MNNTVVFDGELSLLSTFDGELDLTIPEDGELGIITVGGMRFPDYTGATVITPTEETQILETENTSVLTDIVVEPIPNNYGLITWNGRTLTVS